MQAINSDEMDTKYKQVIVLRTDIEMSDGKKCAQSCHASLGSYKIAKKTIAKRWEAEGGKKIVLTISSEKKLLTLYQKAKELKLPCYLVRDGGHTEVPAGTLTALGIGPENNEIIDEITGKLQLL